MNTKYIIPVLALTFLLAAGFIWSYDKAPIQGKETVPDLTDSPLPSELIDEKGNPVNLSDFHGKIVFINNWASWCPPCVAEMSTIEKLKNTFPSNDIAFVMVSFDQDPTKGVKWMKNKKIDLPVYFPAEKFPQDLLTDAIPSTFILDREGNLLFTQVGMADYSKESFITQMTNWIKKN